MKKVLIVQPAIPNYRVPFFDKLKQKGLYSGIEYQIKTGDQLQDFALRKNSITSVPQDEISTRYFRIGSRGLIWHSIPKKLKTADLVIMEHAVRNLISFKFAYFKHPKGLAFWGHGKTYTKQTSFIEERVKMNLALKSDWFFGYTAQGVESITEHGFPSTRATVVLNSTDTTEIIRRKLNLTEESVEAFKKLHSIGNGKIGVFIGALESYKRIDFLLSSAIEIQKRVTEFELIVFGEGSEVEKVVNASAQFPFIKYLGKADIHSQVVISRIGKVILMPGRVGLIAVDSFALGIPLISTDWPWHAPEFEYLIHDYNCIITKDDIRSYVNSICDVLSDERALEELRSNCEKEAENYSIEKMVDNFHGGVLDFFEYSKHKHHKTERFI
jgi:glycosyltransferase involved in cell wall biosynthesis